MDNPYRSPVSQQSEVDGVPGGLGGGSPPSDRIAEIAFRIAEKQQTVESGAHWFYWVAGATVVNSALASTDFGFAVGLGISLLIDAIGGMVAVENPDLGSTPVAIAFGVNVVLAGAFALFGYFSAQGNRVLLGLGMLLYLIDGVLMLTIFQHHALVGLIIHAIALWNMWGAMMAASEIVTLEEELLFAAPGSHTNPYAAAPTVERFGEKSW